MSIKIYEAYRTDLANINKLLLDFKSIAEGSSVKSIAEWLFTEMNGRNISPKLKEGDIVFPYSLWREYFDDKEHRVPMHQHGMNVWIHDNMVYCIPLFGLNLRLTKSKGLESLDYLQDFSYWDNTDPQKTLMKKNLMLVKKYGKR